MDDGLQSCRVSRKVLKLSIQRLMHCILLLVSYDVAQFYLKETHFDLDQAIVDYKTDEEWEKMHPREPSYAKTSDRERSLINGPTRTRRGR